LSKQSNARWADFGIRTSSSLVMAAVGLFCLWQGGWPWRFLINLFLIGLGLEWATLSKAPSRWQVVVIVFFLMIASNFAVRADIPLALGLLAIGAAVTAVFFDKFAAAGIPYAGLGGIALLWLRLQPGVGLIDTLYLILIVTGTDIGAYAMGRLIGGPKLAPLISPGKTWSGAVGGLVIGAGCATGFAYALHWGTPLAFGIGLVLSCIAQAGDLLESAIKRKLGVKDSGRTIPGHGGLFDRLDGFLAAAPVAALLAYLAHGGVPLWR